MADQPQSRQPIKSVGPRPLLRRLDQATVATNGNRSARGGTLLRRLDQATVATLMAAALTGMGVYWFVQGGFRGRLIEIDRATPLTARFQVDINQAEWPELAEVPELGETLARRIVESRATAGPYADLDELLRVNGIGPLRLAKMKPYLLPMPSSKEVAGAASLESAQIP